ncbi:unnamed protein product [Calypogeia fissa]
MAVASAAAKLVCCPSSLSSHHHHVLDGTATAATCESFTGLSCSVSNQRNDCCTRYVSSLGSLKCLRVGVDGVDRLASASSSSQAGRKQSLVGRLDGCGGGFASSSSISLSTSSRNMSGSEGLGSTVKAAFGRKSKHEGGRGSQRIGVFSTHRGEPNLSENSSIFAVADPRAQGYNNPPPGGPVDLNQALEVLWQDVLYLDWRARQDVLAIKSAHDKVVEVLNPLAREQNSVAATREQLAVLQEELARAHTQVHLSEARVEHSLKKLAEIETFINEKLPYSVSIDETKMTTAPTQLETVTTSITTADASSTGVISESSTLLTDRSAVEKRLSVAGPTAPYTNNLKNFWYPVAFSGDISVDTLVPFESFEEPWVLFRGKDGRAGCVRDECAHRACPLSLGKVVDGQIQCPYHGWEYTTGGECTKMPSTRSVTAQIKSLPCIERDGMVWIWPGDEIPATVVPSLNPPSHFTIHAEIVLELPVEHGLLMENLLDLAHAPFTHTTTFAKGWPVPNFVRFRTPGAALTGYWDPYPIDMQFQPPCMVLSTIGLVKPGQLDGSSTQACKNHLHQLHVCMPSTRGKTRLLYRMALDFAQWAKYVPFITKVWMYLANQVLSEDLRLVEGQMDRMKRGANVWKTPVQYDKLGVRYRRWRNAVESGSSRIPFDSGPYEDS